MEQDYKKEIEEIINAFECPKDFECYKSGFEVLCNARDVGLELFVECLEKNPVWCKFSISYGYSYLCDCPLRVFISKKLER